MLKHTGPPSSTTAVPAAGQLRVNTNTSGRGGIHLRQPQQPQQQQQPQPLNLSTLSCTNLPSPVTLTTTTTTTSSLANNISNGGQRIPTLLNIDYATIPSGITATSAAAISAAAGSTGGSTTIATVLPPTATTNGIASNLHIYSNQQQQQYASNSNHTSHHQLHHPHQHHPYNTPNLSPTNNVNTSLLPIPNFNNTTTTTTNNNNNNNTATNLTKSIHNYQQQKHHQGHGPGPREALTSLGLLCLVSLLLALLSLIFLLKISPNDREDVITRSAEDFVVVYDVTVALCALSLSLNLCCLLVCAIQFLFAVKLVRSPNFDGRDNKYLEKSSTSRTCAVGGFFISIPIFLTGIILYTFNHFHSTPAIITSVLIGIGIVFCGGAMVHNVFIWQKEKTISYRSPPAPGSAAAAALLTLPAQINSITIPPPVPPHFTNHTNHLIYNQHNQQQQPPTQAASVTPVSPNHSHGSFCPLAGGPFNSSFMIRPATATPPTPRPPNGCVNMNGREASGSVSPGLPPTLDMSNITSTSLHELSTLV